MQLGIRDVARLMGATERAVYKWIETAGLPANRIGGQYRVGRAELIDWALAHKLPVPQELAGDGAAPDESPPALAAALAAGGVFHNVPGSDKSSALAAAVKAMRLPDGADREFLLSVLVARETMASTGIGDGIAIPHARNPIVLSVPGPVVALCFLATPVEFGAIDGKPVHTLFTLISPTVRAHLSLLAQIARGLREGAFKDAVTQKADESSVVAAARSLDLAAGAAGRGTAT